MSPSTDPAEKPQRELLCEMLRLFYEKEWVSGTGGGICAVTQSGDLLVAPTGVHKERVKPGDFFLVDVSSGDARPKKGALSPSECTPIFVAVVRERGAGSIVHSHALSAVLAADAAEGGKLTIRNLEMLKGIRGAAYPGEHRVPVIENTARERDLTGDVERALKDYDGAFAVLVKDHGAYIWGADVWEAKRHAEVYHFLFEATVRRRGKR